MQVTTLQGCPPSITDLNISFTNIADLAPLSAFTSLRKLNCSNIQGLRSLTGCPPSLTELNCYCSPVTSLAPLTACTALRSINLRGTGVVDLSPLDELPGAVEIEGVARRTTSGRLLLSALMGWR